MKSLLSILIAFLLVVFSSCSKENSTEPAVNSNIDQQLLSVWYNSTGQEGMRINNNGQVTLLEVNNEGLLVESADQSDAPLLSEALSGTFTMYQPDQNLTDTLSGTYNIEENTLSITVNEINGASVTNAEAKIYTRSSVNALVVFKKYLSAKVSGQTFDFEYVSVSYSNQQIIISGSVSFQGSISIRCNIQGPGNYSLNDVNKAVFRDASGVNYSSSLNYTGTLKVERYDAGARYIAGTFSFECENNGNIIQVEAGTFGGKY